MNEKTGRIVKEEILRSVATLFFAMLITLYILWRFDLPTTFFTTLGIPILITVVVTALVVRKRIETGREFKLKPGTRTHRLFFLIIGLLGIQILATVIYSIQKGSALDFRWGFILLSAVTFIGASIKELMRSEEDLKVRK